MNKSKLRQQAIDADEKEGERIEYLEKQLEAIRKLCDDKFSQDIHGNYVFNAYDLDEILREDGD